MKHRILGNDLIVSAVGLGCMGMSHAYGAPANENETALIPLLMPLYTWIRPCRKTEPYFHLSFL